MIEYVIYLLRELILKKLILFILLLCPLVWGYAQYNSKEREKERFIGNLIKESLEKIHYKKMTLDDSVSKKAFPEFLKNIDFSKNFLLQSQVNQLSRYASKMDDQMISGDHELLKMAVSFIQERVKKAEDVRQKIFKKSI